MFLYSVYNDGYFICFMNWVCELIIFKYGIIVIIVLIGMIYVIYLIILQFYVYMIEIKYKVINIVRSDKDIKNLFNRKYDSMLKGNYC